MQIHVYSSHKKPNKTFFRSRRWPPSRDFLPPLPATDLHQTTENKSPSGIKNTRKGWQGMPFATVDSRYSRLERNRSTYCLELIDLPSLFDDPSALPSLRENFFPYCNRFSSPPPLCGGLFSRPWSCPRSFSGSRFSVNSVTNYRGNSENEEARAMSARSINWRRSNCLVRRSWFIELRVRRWEGIFGSFSGKWWENRREIFLVILGSKRLLILCFTIIRLCIL